MSITFLLFMDHYFLKVEKKYTWVVRKWSRSGSGAPTVYKIEHYYESRFIHKTLHIPQLICVLPFMNGFQVEVVSMNGFWHKVDPLCTLYLFWFKGLTDLSAVLERLKNWLNTNSYMYICSNMHHEYWVI